MSDLTIGIDLGTTNSCVSVLINNKIKIFENESGGRITPSFIYFQPDGGIIIGEHAKKMSVNEPRNGIYEMKRLVGRKFDDTQLQKSLDYFPFNVSADSSNNPVVCLKQKGSTIKKTPQELYTILLKQLKKYTEDILGETVNKAVITVPAYFNVTQREVTLAAAKEAGFTVLKLLNEPTAAALAYYYEMDIEETHRSLVYDLGGGTFDVAILERRSDTVEVICVNGDTQLGGHDLDNCILEYIYQHLKDEYDYDPNLDSDDKRRLRNKCEEAKKELSTADAAVITINGMVPSHPKIKITLTRKEFESMAAKFFQRTIDILDKCLSESKLSKSSINEVILCGGSTRIPKIQKLVSNYFDGKQLNKFVNPDECVAEGAALQAAMFSKNKKQKIEQLEMVDVVPLSIGFENMCNKMVFMIKRGTRLPASESHVFVNVNSHQTVYEAGIYEGERSDVRKNRHLGKMIIDNVTAAPPGQRQVILTLSLDLNGILTAKAKETDNNNSKELKVDYNRGDRSDSEIKNTILDAAENRKEDERFLEFVKLKSYLIKYCVGVVYNLEDKNMTESFKEMYGFCKDTKLRGSCLEVEQEEEVKELIEECRRRCEPFVYRYNFKFMPLEV